MALLFILGVGLLGVAAALTLRAAAAPLLRVATQVREIGSYGFGRELAAAPQPRSRLVAAFAGWVGRWCALRLPFLKPLQSKELLAAGKYELSADALHGYRVLGAIGLPTLMLLLMVAGGSLSALAVIATLASGFIAWHLPAAMVRTRGQRRMDRLDRDLPELIDVLIVTIEAGLGFGGSLQLVAGRFDGPLGDELRLTLQEQGMGLSTEDALHKMLARCDTPSVRAFVRAGAQGDALGVSIGAMLRNVASETRKRRRALARERAQRAPLKLLFPLVLLIFPAMLLVLMFPAAYGIVRALGGG
jgi:tight adherence protein C